VENRCCKTHKPFRTKHLRRMEVSLWRFNTMCAAVADEPETKSWNPETHAAPRNELRNASLLTWVQGVWVIQRLLAIQNSCKRITLPLTDFTIQFLAKIQTLKMSVRLTVCVSCGGWEGRLTVETGKTQSYENAQKTRRVPTVSCTHC
jgi:hypothetical protein